MTHTYAILEVSASAYAEIRKLLADAGYEHAFHDDVVDMHGIAIKATDASAPDSVHPSHLPTVIDVLETDLAAMTAARDEACDVAERNDHGLGTVAAVDARMDRISELRKVGAK